MGKRINPEVIYESRDTAAAYLAGLIDGEGCVYFNQANATRAVTIVNTEHDILHACQRLYDMLGIYYTVGTLKCVTYRRKKPGWRIRVLRQAGFQDLYREVPIQSESKKQKLETVLRSFKRNPIVRMPARTPVARNVLKNRKTAAAYLAAIIDGEGHVSPVRTRIDIGNTDDSILNTVIRCYNKLGIVKPHVYNQGKGACGTLDLKLVVIYRQEGIRRIQELIPLQCQYKREALRSVLA